jgi:hypothetical protein
MPNTDTTPAGGAATGQVIGASACVERPIEVRPFFER